MFGSNYLQFSNYEAHRGALIKKTSDHPDGRRGRHGAPAPASLDTPHPASSGVPEPRGSGHAAPVTSRGVRRVTRCGQVHTPRRRRWPGPVSSVVTVVNCRAKDGFHGSPLPDRGSHRRPEGDPQGGARASSSARSCRSRPSSSTPTSTRPRSSRASRSSASSG